MIQIRKESIREMAFLHENTMFGLYFLDNMVSLQDLKNGLNYVCFIIANYLLVL